MSDQSKSPKKKIPLHRLRQISKQRAIRRPQLPQAQDGEHKPLGLEKLDTGEL